MPDISEPTGRTFSIAEPPGEDWIRNGRRARQPEAFGTPGMFDRFTADEVRASAFTIIPRRVVDVASTGEVIRDEPVGPIPRER